MTETTNNDEVLRRHELNRYVPIGSPLSAVLPLTFVNDGVADIFLGDEHYRLPAYNFSALGTKYRLWTQERQGVVMRNMEGVWTSAIKRHFDMRFADNAFSMALHSASASMDPQPLLVICFAQGQSPDGRDVRLVLYPGRTGVVTQFEVTGWRGINPIMPCFESAAA